jgi:hypothetical protein
MYSRAPYSRVPFSGMFPFRYVVPASETPEGKERLQAYYEALGRFIDMFARVETAVALTLWAYAKVKPEIAKIVFAGARIELGSAYIKQLAEATGADHEACEDLGNVLQQLGIINGVRNAVLHYGAESVAEGRAGVSNAWKAKGEPTIFPISPTALDDMTADLRKIATHLNYKHLARPTPRGELGAETLESVLQAPWQYKHPVPPKAQTKEVRSRAPRKRGPKPPRQP